MMACGSLPQFPITVEAVVKVRAAEGDGQTVGGNRRLLRDERRELWGSRASNSPPQLTPADDAPLISQVILAAEVPASEQSNGGESIHSWKFGIAKGLPAFYYELGPESRGKWSSQIIYAPGDKSDLYGSWMHVAMTIDENNEVALFLNGDVVARETMMGGQYGLRAFDKYTLFGARTAGRTDTGKPEKALKYVALLTASTHARVCIPRAFDHPC